MHVPTSAIKNLRDLRQEREGKRSPSGWDDGFEDFIVGDDTQSRENVGTVDAEMEDVEDAEVESAGVRW
ncbi:MAG: hypothetical protein M1813_004753 [Trichoglossum hirsutum]|nr:MAG: hypothetical protein M1813_004753 [Trichoglossum hirsutum]